MYLKKISLVNFKNYEGQQLEFCPQINCLLGDNGSGKTNLLDAIYYLSMSKSAFNSIDSQHIRHNESYFTIQGDFQVDENMYQVFCGVQSGQKKIFKLNKNQYDKISEHIGRFPVVLITPYDNHIIEEGSEERRRFFDSVISQVDSQYLNDLMQYNHILKQRNSLLKQFAERQYLDKDLLSTYDKGILQIGKKIFQKRKSFVADFQMIFQEHYHNIADNQEATNIVYESDFEAENFTENFRRAISKDLDLQRTTQGIHKDDFEFKINSYPLKKYGSQGQQKSFVISLKMAHFHIVKKEKNTKAILLLDDIFDKLDDKRMKKLIQMVADDTFGQIFITDAIPERTRSIFEKINSEKRFYTVSKGKIMEIDND